MSAHDEHAELVALYALGALSDADAAQAREHIAECDACRQEFAILHQVSGSLSFTAEVDEGTADLRLARVKAKLRAAIAAPKTVAPHALPAPTVRGYGVVHPPPTAPPRAPQFASWPLAFAFACVAAAVFAVQAIALRSELLKSRVLIAQNAHHANELQNRSTLADARFAQILASDARRYTIPYGLVVQDSSRLLLVLKALPPLPPGHVYQAWTLPLHAKAMKPGMTFTTNAQGMAFLTVPEQASRVAAVGVTIEPAGGSIAPTTKPLFVQLLG